MANAETIERLRQYLVALSPEARTLLIGELERAVLRGDDDSGAELVLAQLRRIARDERDGAPRVSRVARLFFRPLEPFLISDRERAHPGRIARYSLEALWTWVRRDLLREDAKATIDEVSDALTAGDDAGAEQTMRAFQDRVVEAIDSALTVANADERQQRRILAQIGTKHAAEEVKSLCRVLKGRDTLAELADALPLRINDLADGQLDDCKALIEKAAEKDPDLFICAVLMVMSRLNAPWQLIRLAIKAASDAATRVAETPYAVAVAIVLVDIERQVDELRNDLRQGRGVAMGALLKSIHDGLRGLRTELDPPADGAWARTIAGLRAQIADTLRFEIDNVPSRMRRLLRVRKASDIRPYSTLDPEEVADTEAMLKLIGACRQFAGELAINEIMRRTVSALEDLLQRGTRALAESLRHAGDEDRAFRQSQLDAAVRFCAQVLEPDLADELRQVADAVGASEAPEAPDVPRRKAAPA
jgi:hypothetical protein